MTVLSGPVGLPASLQRNILALQNTQSQIDQVQQRLATGLRVNSALDNADSFFTAKSLSNRAARLSALLDGINTRATAVQEAIDAAGSLQDLLNQASAKAAEAQSELSSTTQEARITGTRNLANVTDLTSISGVTNTDELVFSFVDNDGSINSGNTVVISTNDSISDLIDDINAIADSGASQVFDASLNSAGQLTIATQDNSRFEITFQTTAGAADAQLASALGFGGYTLNEVDDGTSVTRATVLSAPSLISTALFDADTNAVAATDAEIIDLTDTSAGSTGDIFNGDANDAINISVDGSTSVEVIDDISTATLQDLLDGINNNASLNTKIKATYDSTTGELNIRSIDSDVESIQIELIEDGSGAGTSGQIDLQTLGFGTQVLSSAADGSGNTSSESLILGPSASNLASFEADYDAIRTQIDALAEDSEFYNIRLLRGEDLTTIFNEDGTSTLITEGEDFTVSTLGITAANFGSSDAVSSAVAEVDAAITSLENYTSSLSGDLTIILTREDFTQTTINNLEAGAAQLTVADENEEGALLLALQTRQLLGTTALSLASQSQQSTLRLF